MTVSKAPRPAKTKKPDVQNQEPQKPGYAVRSAAAKMLAAVVDQKTPLDGIIDEEHGNPAFRALSAADRSLARAILNSSLRHLGWINGIFDSFLDKPLPEGARHLKHILTVAASQILFLDIPDHAAVDIAVEQANHDSRSRRFASLANALLRRLVREKDLVLKEARGKYPVFPDWFGKRLIEIYGERITQEIAASFLEVAPIDITVKGDPQMWADRLGGVVMPTGSVRLSQFAGSVTELEGFTEGEWWVQDAAASIPARLMGDIKGKCVADLCAAPGGKTAQLILAGADVTAVEQSPNRIKRLKSNLARLRLEAEFIQSKLEDITPDSQFDAILLDAPCSSTGTIRRHPDVVWTKTPADIRKLAEIQLRLLRAAFVLLAPGGRIVFSNCSLDPLEGESLVERFLAETDAAYLIPVDKNGWPELESVITPRGEIRTTPANLGGVDGFFAAVIGRKSAELAS